MSRPISMAAGVAHQDTSPEDMVTAAALANFDGVGLWIEPDTWTDSVTKEVRARVNNTGIRLLDVEVGMLRPGGPDDRLLRILDIGASLGAENLIIVCYDSDYQAAAKGIGQLCDRAGRAMTITTEFMVTTGVKTIHTAKDLMEMVGRPNATMMIDCLHLYRAGNDASELLKIGARYWNYVQVCDIGPLDHDINDYAAYRSAAWDGRLLLGDGVLPLKHFLSFIPEDMPLSLEMRSKWLRDTYPDAKERAQILAKRSREYLRNN